MAAPETQPRGWRLWLLAARPRTLPLAATPVILGAALAYSSGSSVDSLILAMALACALLIQIGTNLHNDAADGEKGTDTPDRLGPQRVTAAGWASAQAVRRAAYGCLGAAFLLGIGLVQTGGWPIVIIGLLSLAAGLDYSAGPWPISHSPLGEVIAGSFFGPVAILGMQIVLGAPITLAALLAGLALGALSAAVLMVNNLRDRLGDAKAGRRTLAIALGPAKARTTYRLLLSAPILLTPWIAHTSGHLGPWLGLLALPAFLRLFQSIEHKEGRALNTQLAATAQASAIYGVLMAVGIVGV